MYNVIVVFVGRSREKNGEDARFALENILYYPVACYGETRGRIRGGRRDGGRYRVTPKRIYLTSLITLNPDHESAS